MTKYYFIIFLTLVLCACNNPKQADAVTAYDVVTIEQNYAAHWLTREVVLLKSASPKAYLVSSSEAKLDKGAAADTQIPLKPIDQPVWVKERYPHLIDYYAFSLNLTDQQIRPLLKNQLAVLQYDKINQASALSYIQKYGVIDTLYTESDDDANEYQSFGAIVGENGTAFSLWAPTAIAVELLLYTQDKADLTPSPLAMMENELTGIWTLTTDIAPIGTFYRYQVTVFHPRTQKIETIQVTDPYSLSLSTNSLHSQVVDLDNPQTKPESWDEHSIPRLTAPENNVLYEVHIRDFSADDKRLSNPAYAGKYKAFSDTNSFAMQHLHALGKAGVNTVHLLPAFDIGTVDEDPTKVVFLEDKLQKVCTLDSELDLCNQGIDKQRSLKDILQTADTSTSEVQRIIERLRTNDPYNWGYDPFHYTVPEGSYAQQPDGMARIVEFREMVQSLHTKGFRVVMDVVYNHTYASGLSDKSVLDKIVPNYYHRLDIASGDIEQSTCCDNTATERSMMEKLMVDSLVVWARDYKIDGFRFDLMGHQPKSAMLNARAKVREIDADTYFYGEGWNFGEVANNAQFIQANQSEMAGTEIGTFTDRLRDAVRGGSSFASKQEIRAGQGIGNGLITIPNEMQTEDNASNYWQEYYLSMDQIRVGLAGNLAEFPLINGEGVMVKGKDIDYGGGPTGYALDPADTINYVSKHDNQTLWDNNQYRIAHHVKAADRARMQILSLSYPVFAQGIPFLHMGSELLRSKSFLRDSYDYADWFNKVDFSMQSNNYNVGLPPWVKDGDNWETIKQIIKNNEGRDLVSPELIERSSAMFLDLLSIRSTSPLFRLTNAKDIIERVSFINTGPDQKIGLIAMQLSDIGFEEVLDPLFNSLLVIFNNSDKPQTLVIDTGLNYSLHPIQQNGVDSVAKKVKIGDNTVTVPPLTTVVLVN
jgi:pullulanase